MILWFITSTRPRKLWRHGECWNMQQERCRDSINVPQHATLALWHSRYLSAQCPGQLAPGHIVNVGWPGQCYCSSSSILNMLCFDMRITGTRQPNGSIVLDVKRIQSYTSYKESPPRSVIACQGQFWKVVTYTVMLRSIFSLENFLSWT